MIDFKTAFKLSVCADIFCRLTTVLITTDTVFIHCYYYIVKQLFLLVPFDAYIVILNQDCFVITEGQ